MNWDFSIYILLILLCIWKQRKFINLFKIHKRQLLQWKIRTCLLEMFCKKSVLKNFAKFTGKNLRWIPSLCSQTCNFAYKWFPLANGCFWKLLYGNLCLKAITILWIFLSDFQTTTGKFLGPCQRFMMEFFAKIGNC